MYTLEGTEETQRHYGGIYYVNSRIRSYDGYIPARLCPQQVRRKVVGPDSSPAYHRLTVTVCPFRCVPMCSVEPNTASVNIRRNIAIVETKNLTCNATLEVRTLSF